MVRTIKVVGVSGCGKSTLLRLFMEKHPGFSSMSYGEFLAKYGKNSDEQWQKMLAQNENIVIIDDHLEWGDRDFVSLYRKENTLAILLITADPQNILSRRMADQTRLRDLDIETLEKEQEVSRRRAFHIADRLAIPIYELHDASIDESVSTLEQIIHEVG